MRVGRTPGDWSAVRALDLRVEPRWFERPEVRAAGALVLLGLAWSAHAWRLRHAARRQAMLEEQVRLRTAELEQSRAQVELLSIHNARSLEQERTRVSRELHDEMAQQLAALRMELSLLQRAPGRSPSDQALPVPALVQRVDAIIRSIRELVTQLRPPALDGGLRPAIEWMAARFEQQTGIRCTLELAESEAFANPDAATMAFRVVQESLTNVRRHAHATSVRILLTAGPLGARLEITDNGRGFEPLRATSGYGLLGMRERVTALGGRLELLSSPGLGTTVRVTMG
jgi:signal transduction histidine kinase